MPNYKLIDSLMNISVCVSKNACFYAYDLYMDIEHLHINKQKINDYSKSYVLI